MQKSLEHMNVPVIFQTCKQFLDVFLKLSSHSYHYSLLGHWPKLQCSSWLKGAKWIGAQLVFWSPKEWPLENFLLDVMFILHNNNWIHSLLPSLPAIPSSKKYKEWRPPSFTLQKPCYFFKKKKTYKHHFPKSPSPLPFLAAFLAKGPLVLGPPKKPTLVGSGYFAPPWAPWAFLLLQLRRLGLKIKEPTIHAKILHWDNIYNTPWKN